MYINKVFLFGNLTRDPELKSLPSGTSVVNCGLATNRRWKDKDGNQQESTEFHNLVAFGKPAELISQYLAKGRSIFVEGRLQTRSWEGDDGQKRYRTEIVVENFQFGPRGGDSSQGGGTSANKSRGEEAEEQHGGKEGNLDTIEYPDDDVKPEDIPF